MEVERKNWLSTFPPYTLIDVCKILGTDTRDIPNILGSDEYIDSLSVDSIQVTDVMGRTPMTYRRIEAGTR
jgi:hypothetical protein